jgi:hypothetical protein
MFKTSYDPLVYNKLVRFEFRALVIRICFVLRISDFGFFHVSLSAFTVRLQLPQNFLESGKEPSILLGSPH